MVRKADRDRGTPLVTSSTPGRPTSTGSGKTVISSERPCSSWRISRSGSRVCRAATRSGCASSSGRACNSIQGGSLTVSSPLRASPQHNQRLASSSLPMRRNTDTLCAPSKSNTPCESVTSSNSRSRCAVSAARCEIASSETRAGAAAAAGGISTDNKTTGFQIKVQTPTASDSRA